MPQPPWLSYKAEFFFGDHEKTGVSFSAGTQVGNKGRIRPSQFWSSEQKVGKVGGGPQGEKMRGLDYKHQGHSFFFFLSAYCIPGISHTISHLILPIILG